MNVDQDDHIMYISYINPNPDLLRQMYVLQSKISNKANIIYKIFLKLRLLECIFVLRNEILNMNINNQVATYVC